MRWLVPLVAALASLVVTVADMDVGGVYSQRTRWGRAHSPYTASSDVLITESGELQIDPGVVVRFRPGIGVTVRGGRLVAKVSPLRQRAAPQCSVEC